jgi:outer membrane immunogenic protein
MKTKRMLLASAVCFAPFAASAADLPRKAPAYIPPPPFTWTGFYIGASAGIISQGTKADIEDPVGVVAATASVTGFGFIGGVDIGYNWQFAPNWVIGLEADISGTSLDNSSDFFGSFGHFSSRLDALGTVRARFGYAFDRALLYATGGWAFGHVKNGADFPTAPVLNISTDEWRSGWTAGGGLEYAITPNTWTVRVEALYVDLGTTTIDQNPAIVDCRFGFKNRYVIGRLGVNYKF